MLCYTEQIHSNYPRYDDDDNAMSGDVNDGQPEHNDWLHEYAKHLSELNLTFLPDYEGGPLVVDTVTEEADGWPPVSLHTRINSESLSVLRATTGVCIAAIIDWKIRADCWGCTYNTPSQKRHTCLCKLSQDHYETHYDDICVVLGREPFGLLMDTILKNTTGLILDHKTVIGAVDTMLCDILAEFYVMDQLGELALKCTSPEYQRKIIEATRLWRRTLEWRRTTPRAYTFL